MTDQPAPIKAARVKRVRLNTFITPDTHATVKRLNREGVARSDGAVLDLAVSDLSLKVTRDKNAQVKKLQNWVEIESDFDSEASKGGNK